MPPNGVYKLLVKALVDFFTQVADVYVDDVRATLVFVVPEIVLDLFTREDHALVAHHKFKKRILLRGQVNNFFRRA